MNCFSILESTFKNYGLELEPRDPFFRIQNSYALPTSIALEIICKAGFCPVISLTRLHGDLEFTIVPFAKPPIYEKLVCRKFPMDVEQLRNSLASTASLIVKVGPICIQGKQIFSSLQEAKVDMVKGCQQPSTFVIEYSDLAKDEGRLLDLGCGLGANSTPFLEKKWNILAIDTSPLALNLFREKIQSIDSNYLACGQLKLVESDITECQLEANAFDLAICVDVLPYVKPKRLEKLIHKIHDALAPNGKFIGTLFCIPFSGSNALTELMDKLGAHHYEDSLTYALLKNGGFQVEECIYRLENATTEPTCVQFIASKTSDASN